MPRGGARPGAGRRKGTPNKVTADIKAVAMEYSAAAVETLASIMRAAKSPAAARVAAANAILDRAYGKPKQAVDVEGALAGTLSVTYVTAATSPAPAPSEEDYETD